VFDIRQGDFMLNMSLQLVAFSRLTKYLYFRVDLRRMTLFIKPKSFKKKD